MVSSRCKKPVLNAGDGIGEHPTQALLDLFTIYNELELSTTFSQETNGNTNDQELIVVMLGDLKNGRTVHSLAKLFAQTVGYGVVSRIVLRYCAPSTLEMPANVQDYVHTSAAQKPADDGSVRIVQETYTSLTEAVQNAHVLYVTRIQRERFDSDAAYNAVKVGI
jgi:aspartate carbamoyltransferase catalytic subunit